MKPQHVIVSLAALAQKSRLAVFRHLVQLGPLGARPGDIAAQLRMSASTLSFHLKALTHAGLLQPEQSGRSITYRADFEAMQGLIDYLTENCCGGDASLCAPKCGPAKGANAPNRVGRAGTIKRTKPVVIPAKAGTQRLPRSNAPGPRLRGDDDPKRRPG